MCELICVLLGVIAVGVTALVITVLRADKRIIPPIAKNKIEGSTGDE